MKKGLFLVGLLFILLFSAGNIFGADNLVQNASFEDGSNSNPAFWEFQAWDKEPETTEYKYESGNARTGNKCVTITCHKENDARYVQEVNVSENKMYMLSCWIRASNIPKEKKGANISIEGKLESSADVWETNGQWQQTAMYARTGAGITSFKVTVGIGTYGSTNTGIASFDDVSVVEVSSIPDGAVVCNLLKESEQQQTGNQNANQQNSTTSIFGWILFVGIFVVIIVFVLYRSLTKSTPQADESAGSEGAGDEAQVTDTTADNPADSPADSSTKDENSSDDLL